MTLGRLPVACRVGLIDGAGNRSTVLAGTLTILPGIVGPDET